MQDALNSVIFKSCRDTNFERFKVNNIAIVKMPSIKLVLVALSKQTLFLIER